jgi:hypothetical protein
MVDMVMVLMVGIEKTDKTISLGMVAAIWREGGRGGGGTTVSN